MSTVTTVGYGYTVPESAFGKIDAIVLMVVGVGFVALLTAFTSERFIRSEGGRERQESMIAKLDSIEARLERMERGN